MATYNPYDRLDLKIPKAYLDRVHHYTRSQTDALKRSTVDQSPFKRYVDVWFLAVLVGAARGRKEPLEQSHTFISGEILSRDPERIEYLEMLAIGSSEDAGILGRPADVIEIANQFAAAGLPQVLVMLEEGNQDPIWNLTRSIQERIGPSTKAV